MELLKEIFIIMLYILGIITILLIIISLLKTAIKERKTDKAVDEFANVILTQLEKELEEESKPKKVTKKRKTTTKKQEN